MCQKCSIWPFLNQFWKQIYRYLKPVNSALSFNHLVENKFNLNTFNVIIEKSVKIGLFISLYHPEIGSKVSKELNLNSFEPFYIQCDHFWSSNWKKWIIFFSLSLDSPEIDSKMSKVSKVWHSIWTLLKFKLKKCHNGWRDQPHCQYFRFKNY